MSTVHYFKEGRLALQAGNYQQAVDLYEKAASERPELAHIYRFALRQAKAYLANKENSKLGISAHIRNGGVFNELFPANEPALGWSHKNIGSMSRTLKSELGIDQIYVINLTHRTDRYIRILREMNRHGVTIQRVEGVDGRFSEVARSLRQAFRDRPIKAGKPSSSHVSDDVMARYKTQLSLGAFGYILSQGKVLKDALQKGYGRILVYDDDVFFCADALERLGALASKLPKDLKVLLLGASEYSDRDCSTFQKSRFLASGDLYHPIPGNTCGSFAVVYDRSVFAELLDVIEEADGTYDNVALGAIYRRYPKQCLAVDPAICIPDVSESDIRGNKRSQITHSAKMNWAHSRYREFTEPFSLSVLVNSFDSLRHAQSLQHELGSSIFLNIFYLSEDGLRPVVVGHQFEPIDQEASKIDAVNGFELRALAHDLHVPYSDIVISWPPGRVLTEESATAVFAAAMEAMNNAAMQEGASNGIVYCLNAGRAPIKGKHSIIIPSCRAVEYVWPAVRSALLQDAKNFEVIVVNDNPSDQSFSATLRNKAENWDSSNTSNDLAKRLIIIDHHVNRKASAARNTGLIRSSGEFISFLDDDDHFESQRLSAVDNALAGMSAEVGGCYCGYSGNWNGERSMDRFIEGDLGDRVLALRYREHYMNTNTVSFVRKSLQRLGGFNECYIRHQDLELMVRFFKQFEIVAVKEFLVRNRPNPAPETFIADVPQLCRIKQQFLSDMSSEILSRGKEFAKTVIDAHTNDVVKRDRSMAESTISTIRTFLAASLRIENDWQCKI